MTAVAQNHFLVTGASSGIGQAVVAQLLGADYRVTGVARRSPHIDNARLGWIQLDLGDLDKLAKQDAAFRSLSPLHGAVLSHGFGDFDGLEQFTAARIRQLIDTNLTSTILLCRVLLPLLKQQEKSTLVLVGSESAVRGGRQGAAYAASKFGIRGLAQSLREECSASGVRVCLINPGMVATPFFDDTWLAPGPDRDNALEPEDVAKAISHAVSAPDYLVTDEINLSPLKKVVRQRRCKPG